MGLDQRELYRIRVTMEKETKVGSIGIELTVRGPIVWSVRLSIILGDS